MAQANPTYLIEHLGSTTRITVTHVFTDEERLQFTVILPSGPDATESSISSTAPQERVSFFISGGLLGLEVVEQALHGVHAGLFDRALGDLADRRERHAGFTRNHTLRDLLFSKSRHDHLVKIDWVFHGYES